MKRKQPSNNEIATFNWPKITDSSGTTDSMNKIEAQIEKDKAQNRKTYHSLIGVDSRICLEELLPTRASIGVAIVRRGAGPTASNQREHDQGMPALQETAQARTEVRACRMGEDEMNCRP
ncbi:unnamed protein product [Urochloa humidicola]